MIYLSTHAAGSTAEAARLRARVHRILKPFNLAAIPPHGFPEHPPGVNAETAASVVHSRLGSAILRAEAAIIVLNTPSTVAGIELMMLIDRFDRYRCAVPAAPFLAITAHKHAIAPVISGLLRSAEITLHTYRSTAAYDRLVRKLATYMASNLRPEA